MSGPGPTFTRAFAALAGPAFAAAAVSAVLGWVATAAHHDRLDAWAIVVGCAISWAASCAGAVPVALALRAAPTGVATAILTATAVRFLVALLLVGPLALSGWFDEVVLVVSVAGSYLILLLLDTLLAARFMQRLIEKRES